MSCKNCAHARLRWRGTKAHWFCAKYKTIPDVPSCLDFVKRPA